MPSLVLGEEYIPLKSLYLGTLSAREQKRQQFQFSRNPVDISDIEGTSPPPRHHKFLRDNINSQDISTVKRLHAERAKNAPYLYYRNDDIELSMPPVPKTTFRSTNPLDPHYKLPSYEERPITPPKFVRDTIDVSDIEGTRKKDPKKPTSHDSLYYYDVHKVKGKQLFPTPRDILNVSDINTITHIPPKPKNVNPVEPIYDNLDGTRGDELADSHPKPLPKPLCRYSLETSDIEGAQQGWLPPAQCRSGKHLPMVVKKPRDVFKVEGIQKPRRVLFAETLPENSIYRKTKINNSNQGRPFTTQCGRKVSVNHEKENVMVLVDDKKRSSSARCSLSGKTRSSLREHRIDPEKAPAAGCRTGVEKSKNLKISHFPSLTKKVPKRVINNSISRDVPQNSAVIKSKSFADLASRQEEMKLVESLPFY
ncbi:hypothetical protein P9112_008406 [Eukaryota sp. TZLM1-RC]